MTHLVYVRGGLSVSVSKLQWFLVNNPPLVLFTACITLFVLILATTSLYVTYQDNITYTDDVSQDWNVFLTSFSKLEFCIQQENISASFLHQELKKRLRPTWWPSDDDVVDDKSHGLKSYSVPMSSVVRPNKDFYSIPRDVTHLSASMAGKHMGIKGDDAIRKLKLSLVVPHRSNTSRCTDNLQPGCDVFETDICVEFRGPKSMFPSEKGLNACREIKYNRTSEYWAKMNWQFRDVDVVNFCRSKTMIEIHHEPDLKLSATLQLHRRMLSRTHLLYTCYFLLVCIALVLGYAAFYGRPTI